jgi:hypothetical protein
MTEHRTTFRKRPKGKRRELAPLEEIDAQDGPAMKALPTDRHREREAMPHRSIRIYSPAATVQNLALWKVGGWAALLLPCLVASALPEPLKAAEPSSPCIQSSQTASQCDPINQTNPLPVAPNSYPMCATAMTGSAAGTTGAVVGTPAPFVRQGR